jgi:hypothetical protein
VTPSAFSRPSATNCAEASADLKDVQNLKPEGRPIVRLSSLLNEFLDLYQERTKLQQRGTV